MALPRDSSVIGSLGANSTAQVTSSYKPFQAGYQQVGTEPGSASRGTQPQVGTHHAYNGLAESDPACSAQQRPTELELHGASLRFGGKTNNTGTAGRAESLEEPEGQLGQETPRWGMGSPQGDRKRPGHDDDLAEPIVELMDDDELFYEFQAHHPGLQPATKSEPQDFAQQQQQRQDHDSWAAVGALGSHFEEPDSSAGPSAYFHEPRLSPDHEQQQQQDSYPPEGYSDWPTDGGFEQRESTGPPAYPYDPRLVRDYQQQKSDSPKAYSEEAADEDEVEDDGGEDEETQGWQNSSKTCCACDNGGEIMMCDGPCQRAFHYGIEPRYYWTNTDEEVPPDEMPEELEDDNPRIEKMNLYDEAHCNPLRMDQELMQYLIDRHTTFECPNCLAKTHQCFSCKREGTEGKDVINCSVGSCGRFYHRACLEVKYAECQKRAAEEGLWDLGGFICPLHTCKSCNKGSEADDKGQLIPCARCPRAYHLLCLPPKIMDSERKRVWLNNTERERWGTDHDLFRRPGIEKMGGVEDCIQYCQRHPIPDGFDNPQRMRPLISKPLLTRWEAHMANEHKQLTWSQEYRRRTREEQERKQAEAEIAAAQQVLWETELKLLHLQQQRSQALKRKRDQADVPIKQKQDPTGKPRRKRLVTKAELETGAAAGEPAKSAGSDEMEDMPLAQRLHRAPGSQRSSAAAAAACSAPNAGEPKQKKAKAAGRGAEAASKRVPASPDFLNLDSTPVRIARRKPSLASEKTAPVALLGSPQHSAPAQQLPNVVQELPVQVGHLGSSKPATQKPMLDAMTAAVEDVIKAKHEVFEVQPDQAEAGKDIIAQMVDNIREYEEPDLPEFIGLEALPPPTADLAAAAAAAVAAEAYEEDLQLYEKAEHWAADKMASRLAAMLNKAKNSNPIEQVEILTPRPFDIATTATIPQTCLKEMTRIAQMQDIMDNKISTLSDSATQLMSTRLEEMARTVKMQEVMHRRGLTSANLLSPDLVDQMFRYQDRMQTYLAPFLHRDRYTSYGRHFTQDEHLRLLNEFLLPLIHDGDTVVDFSCGANVWVPMLKNMCLEAGFEIKGVNYDIITPKCMEDFRHGTWYDVKQGDLPNGNQLIIGLNPPFGKNGSLAGQFARLAAIHRPRLIVLIVPPQTPIPDGYLVLREEASLMKGECFFVPGSTEKSWNQTAPATRILVRQDLFDRVANMAGMDSVVHHTFEQHPLPGMGMGMPMQVHMQAGYPPDYMRPHPLPISMYPHPASAIAGYPNTPLMNPMKPMMY